MTKDDILVLKPMYKMKESKVLSTRLDIKQQLVHGNVITVPFGWSVAVAPKDIEIKIAEKPEEVSTPWDFIDNDNYSPFDSQGKERLIFCTECGCNIEHYDAQYQYCPYCGKRHYFNKQEDKKEDKDEEIWCTECPYFKYVADDMDDSWYGTKCHKDGHEASPSMYAVQSLHDDCPLKKGGE